MVLRGFFEKEVRIKTIDNEIIEATVVTYTPAIDSEENLEEIGIYKLGTKYPLYGITESEIKTIELLTRR